MLRRNLLGFASAKLEIKRISYVSIRAVEIKVLDHSWPNAFYTCPNVATNSCNKLIDPQIRNLFSPLECFLILEEVLLRVARSNRSLQAIFTRVERNYSLVGRMQIISQRKAWDVPLVTLLPGNSFAFETGMPFVIFEFIAVLLYDISLLQDIREIFI